MIYQRRVFVSKSETFPAPRFLRGPFIMFFKWHIIAIGSLVLKKRSCSIKKTRKTMGLYRRIYISRISDNMEKNS